MKLQVGHPWAWYACLFIVQLVSHTNYFLPAGIETIVLYWPVKLRENGRVLFFRLQLWDCGENALRRFDHLLPVSITDDPGKEQDISDK